MSLDDDEAEHSIEMHLPYTFKILERLIWFFLIVMRACQLLRWICDTHVFFVLINSKIDSIKIVPILVGALSTSKEVLYGKLLAPYLENPENLFIISSDFCHW